MLDDKALEQNLHALIVDLCRVMHSHGYESISVGAMMRLIGVGDKRASPHDDEWIDLAEYFQKNTQVPDRPVAKINSEGRTLH